MEKIGFEKNFAILSVCFYGSYRLIYFKTTYMYAQLVSYLQKVFFLALKTRRDGYHFAFPGFLENYFEFAKVRVYRTIYSVNKLYLYKTGASDSKSFFKVIEES